MTEEIKPETAGQTEVETNKKANSWRQIIKNKQILALIFWVAVMAAVFVYNNFHPGVLWNFGPGYAKVYSLVEDKISQSASIAINVAPGVTPEEMQAGTTFAPEINGQWLGNADKKAIVFQPAEKLAVGSYYTVTACTSRGVIRKDFLADEDPKITAIFPAADSEAHEQADITIVFNRPMAAVSILDESVKKGLPIEISPATAGVWRWISPRVLKFSGDNGLLPSSHYNIQVKSGLTSLDGLAVPETSQQFITRPLRYESWSEGEIVYAEPAVIRFNQAVDLWRTAGEIAITLGENGEKIDFIPEYGQKKVYNDKKQKFEEATDESVINLYQKKDKFGRSKLWDTEKRIVININRVYPKSGDIDLAESKQLELTTSALIKSLAAESKRTSYASADLFDPTGELVVSFYEDIDLERSKISADKPMTMNYAEKCQGDDDIQVTEDVVCDREPDYRRIKIKFDEESLNAGADIALEFKEIANREKVTINEESIKKTIAVYRPLAIRTTFPSNGARNAALTDLTVCTNNPLAMPARADFGQYLTADKDFEIKSWGNSIEVPQASEGFQCQPGEFETKIEVGLMPETDYQLELKPADVFGQTATAKIGFKTGKMPEEYLNFYHYQKYYSVTPPINTKLAYAGENMEYVDLQICRLSPEKMLDYLTNKPKYWQGPEAVSGCLETKTARINLPKKYWIKNNFEIDLKDYFADPTGQYILTFTNPSYYDRATPPKRVYERTYLTVTNLSVVEKREEIWQDENNPDANLKPAQADKLKNVYWIVQLNNLSPVANAEVIPYSGDASADRTKLTAAGSYRSNEQGIAETKVVNQANGTIVKSGQDSALIAEEIDKLDWGSTAYNAQKIYLYSDRPIYRPGDAVSFKGIYRIGFDGDYEIYRDQKMPVKIYDSQNNEIYSQELPVNEFGTFNGEFTLPSGADLGSYRIEAKDYGYAFFDVEEYAAAAFKVESKTDKDEYISGDTVNTEISASYYFDAPLEGGSVEYSLVSQDYYFDKYKDEYFNFGSGWYDCWRGCSYGDQFILRGQTDLDGNGQAKIGQLIDIGKLFKDSEDRSSKIFTYFITVKNSNGQAVSAQKSFIVHAGEYYLGLSASQAFAGKDEKITLKAKSVDTAGQAISANNLKLATNRIRWVYAKRQEVDGAYYYQWDKQLEKVAEENISTDSQGNWQKEISFDQEGEYQLDLSGLDKRGNQINSSLSLYVYGSGRTEVKPTNDDQLELAVENASPDVGDQAEIIIKSPYNKAKALVSIERGRIFEYQIIDINQNLSKFSFPVKEEYLPNFYVSVTLLSDKPEVKYGSQGFTVNADRRKLNISVKAGKDYYLPGEEVELNFEAKDWQGKGVETEISAAVVDLSVLALKGNPKKNPEVFFYDYFPLAVSAVSNLKNVLFRADIPIGTKGGGGSEPEDLAAKKRGTFKDTAYWQAEIKTDKDGKAQVKFALPDNLTTWQAEAVGVTRDTLAGAAYLEFIARKDLMIVPILPRFIIAGDEFYAGAKIFNNTDKQLKVAAAIAADSLISEDAKQDTVKIEAKDSATLYFKLKAPDNFSGEKHQITLSAQADNYQDEIESSLLQKADESAETAAMSGYSDLAVASESLYLPEGTLTDKGSLTVTVGASPAAFSYEALNDILLSPYDGLSDWLEKLQAAAAAGQAAKTFGAQLKDLTPAAEFENKQVPIDAFVTDALIRIKAEYKANKLAYYPGGQPNLALEIEVLRTLKALKTGGLATDEELISLLSDSLNQRIKTDKEVQSSLSEQVLIFSALRQSPAWAQIEPALTAKIMALGSNDKYLNEDASSALLGRLAEALAEQSDEKAKALLNKINKILANRIEFDSRGAFLRPALGSVDWQYRETAVLDTALALKALARAGRDTEVCSRLERWLVKSKGQSGWGSTENTLIALDALTESIKTRLGQTAFQVEVAADQNKLTAYQFVPGQIGTEVKADWPLNRLTPGYASQLSFRKDPAEAPGRYYYDLALTYFLPAEAAPPRDEGMAIRRSYFAFADQAKQLPVTSAKAGEVLQGCLSLTVPNGGQAIRVEDQIPAGVELVNFNLETSDQSLNLNDAITPDQTYWEKEWYDANIKLWPDDVQMRDDRLYLFKQNLAAGTYEYCYFVRALTPGTFRHLPATAKEKYFPEVFGRSESGYFRVMK